MNTKLLCSILICSTVSFAANVKPPQQPVFVDGLSQPVYAKSAIIKESLLVNAANGQKIHITIERPKETNSGVKLPAVLRPSPYNGTYIQSDKIYSVSTYLVDVDALYDGSPNFNNTSEVPVRQNNKHADRRNLIYDSASKYYLLDRGYVAIQIDGLGTGQSSGCPPMGTIEDGIALKSVVDWLNGRTTAYTQDGNKQVFATWSTGLAATMGISYNGFMSLSLAETGVPELKTALVFSGPHNWYDYYRGNGSVRDAGGGDGKPEELVWRGEEITTLFEFVLNAGSSSLCNPTRQLIKDSIDRNTGNYNAFWDQRNALKNVSTIASPIFVYQGLIDDNVRTSQSINLYNELKLKGKDVKLMLHQGGHEFPAVGPAVYLPSFNRIFSQFLFGQNNGVMADPEVTVQREDKTTIQSYSSFPDPAASNTTFRFLANGDLTPSGQPNGVATIIDSKDYLDVLIGASSSPSRLIYKTPVLAHDVKLSGFPSLTLRFAITPVNPNPQATTAAANISAALVEFSDNSYKIITRGWIDPQNRDNLSTTSPIANNSFYNLTFKLEPNDYVFGSGKQIGIVLYSTDNEFNLSPTPGTTVSIDRSQSSLTLPLVGY